MHWPERTKYWFFGHGGTIDLETVKIVYGKKLERVGQRMAYARGLVESGTWQANREKDEPTYALETAEHGGRTRGYGEYRGSMASLKIDRLIEAAKERRKRKQSGCVGWRQW